MRHLLILALLLISVFAVQEIQLEHRKRTPKETRRLRDYLSRSCEFEKIHKVLSILMPHKYKADIYSYPEVKIYNYMDAQYYG